MIDFSALQGLTIPEGAVTQITDASGMVLWAVQGNLPVILEVEKITSDTYAGETKYTGEQFILLDIYPKTNGTVSVTYGGLTKTITDTSGAAEPNAQQVFFGTFNGVADEVTTPTSGELVIEGSCVAFGCGSYKKSSVNNSKSTTTTEYCGCITNVKDFGSLSVIGAHAFYNCTKLISISIPKKIKEFRSMAFSLCENLASVYITSIKGWCKSTFASGTSNPLSMGGDLYVDGVLTEDVTIPEEITDLAPFVFYQFEKLKNVSFSSELTAIGNSAFYGCTSLTQISLPNSVTTIEPSAFANCNGATLLSLPNGIKSIPNYAFKGISDYSFSEFPEGLVNIGDGAFQIYKNIGTQGYVGKDIVLPSTLTSIGDNAFSSAWGYGASDTQYEIYVKNVRILATTPPTAGFEIFGVPGVVSIVVPKGCGEAYKAADGWSAYANYIVEADE